MKMNKSRNRFGMLLGMVIFGVAFSGLAKTIYVTNPNDTASGFNGNLQSEKNLNLRQAFKLAGKLGGNNTIISLLGTTPQKVPGPILVSPNTIYDLKNGTLQIDSGVAPFNLFDISFQPSGQIIIKNGTIIGNSNIGKKSGAVCYIHKSAIQKFTTTVELDSMSISNFDVDSNLSHAVISNKNCILNLNSCNFSNNTSDSGAVYNENGNLSYTNTTFGTPDSVIPVCDTGDSFTDVATYGTNVTIRLPDQSKNSYTSSNL